MLKSLKKLRTKLLGEFGSCIASVDDARELADEIQEEIDRYYLPRPLFEDGEPADFGMEYVTGRDEVEKIETFVFSEDDVDINPSGQQVGWSTWWNRPLRHSIESDSQEQIDEDYKALKNKVINYTINAGLVADHREASAFVSEFDAILARQRRLDGVEQ